MVALASQLPDSKNADARRRYGNRRALVLLPALAALLAPAGAWGDIYKWTDEQGGTVISDLPPTDPGKASDLKLLATTPKRAAQSPVTTPAPAPDTREQELEARVEELERELQEQQAAQYAPPVAQASDGGGYYAAPPAPEPSGYVSYRSEYYPAYYPSYYAPAAPPVYSYIVLRPKPVVHRRTSLRRPASAPPAPKVRPPPSVNRPPVFVPRPPQFAHRLPQFADRLPPFLGQPATGIGTRTSLASRPSSTPERIANRPENKKGRGFPGDDRTQRRTR